MRLVKFFFFLLALSVSAVAGGERAAAYKSTSVVIFYADLEPYGRWIEHPIYGTVWVPATHKPGWAPYYDGRWVWTAEYGWDWDSYEEFGWATYHYGRWILTSDLGWVWVPDDVWGPAWVDWRYDDDGYVGWAPMPSQYRWRSGALITAGADLSLPRYTSNWIFVSERDFANGDLRGHRVPSNRNRKLIAASARVTNYAAVDDRIVNRSIDPVRLSSKTKVHISTAHIGMAASMTERTRIRNAGYVPIFRPEIIARSKLDLDVKDVAAPRVDSGIDAGTSVDTGRPTSGSNAGIDLGASVGSEFGRPIGGTMSGGVGGGIGLGGGGGLRLGR
jgi:hypothetical protein